MSKGLPDPSDEAAGGEPWALAPVNMSAVHLTGGHDQALLCNGPDSSIQGEQCVSIHFSAGMTLILFPHSLMLFLHEVEPNSPPAELESWT